MVYSSGMFKRSIIFFPAISLLFIQIVNAQTGITIGEERRINSAILQEERTIQLYLPESYYTSDRHYPTLYILDGQWYFLNGVAIQRTLRGETFLPEMIIVGIVMERPGRDQVYDQRWNEFTIFIEQELVGYIDKNYRSNGERLLFGWENSAFFTTELLVKKDSPFSGAIATNGANITQEMLTNFNQAQRLEKKYLFLANTEKDIYTISYTNNAVNVLQENKPPNLIWRYDKFNDEIHESLTYQALYQGLKFYYHNFASPVFSSIQEFYDAGGLPALHVYFEQRSARFGLPQGIDDATKNTLIWMAWKEDNFDAFKLFMNEFAEVLTTRRYASAYWQNRLAQFYLKYNSLDESIRFFEQGINQYPDKEYMAQLYSGLGKACLKMNDKKRAEQNFRLAIEAAEMNGDDQLPEYQELLRSMKK